MHASCPATMMDSCCIEQRAVEKKAEVPDASDSAAGAEGGHAAATDEAPPAATTAQAAAELGDTPMPEAMPEQPKEHDPITEDLYSAAKLGPVAEEVASSANAHVDVDEQQDTTHSTYTQASPLLSALPVRAETTAALFTLTTPRGSHLEALSDDEDDVAGAPSVLASVVEFAVTGGIQNVREVTAVSSEERVHVGTPAEADTTVTDGDDAEAGSGHGVVGSEEGAEVQEETHMHDEDAEDQQPAGPHKTKEEILMQIQVCAAS